MTERLITEKLSTFDSLDVTLSDQMENEGCPNPGAPISIGALARTKIIHDPKSCAVQETPLQQEGI